MTESKQWIDIETNDEFEELLRQIKGNYIIYFSASWCKPCGQISQYVKELYDKCTNTIFIKIDFGKEELLKVKDNIKQKYNFKHIPHFKFYKDNKNVLELTAPNFDEFNTLSNMFYLK